MAEEKEYQNRILTFEEYSRALSNARDRNDSLGHFTDYCIRAAEACLADHGVNSPGFQAWTSAQSSVITYLKRAGKLDLS